ncbi:hypothetical protein M408DRAFT_30019 [Serendipita vermifera MAFF 305830]|uniref:Mitochondrial presequence protease n=1 Tax=Serendipita vermifera MAFF 305830 TaxID=933852 RepID=A0A0C3ALF9_SERVB|nr:hypothetical protein M408DRAFT_30019 [Serendipita vermifera MAFF 305830]
MSSPPIEETNGSNNTSTSESVGDFHLLKRIALNYTDVTITKWRSEKTGLRVIHVDYEGPIINGYFAVATEIFDDSGCPHTLEHLVFHGSEQYPYSDALQRIAFRSFASTPNAYTAQDTTVYTISTAGGTSFLRLLPVYVDHILYPRLTESTFVTEVFHINGEGQDAGVVYSEMQGRQNTVADLVDLAYRRKLFPKGNGYRSETGGLMEALRTLNLAKIQDYHSRYYAPHNLCLVVTGRLSTQALLEEVQKTIEVRAGVHEQDKGIKPDEWKRPFMETESAIVPKIESNSSISVEFPAKEERFGEITIVTIGPSPDDEQTSAALSLLGEYLTGNIVAPLNKELVDIANPYCTSIGIGSTARAKFTEIHVTLSDVPTKYLGNLEIKLRKILQKIARQGLDMKRMHSIIDRVERLGRHGLEEVGGEAFSGIILQDFLYGDDYSEKLEKQLQLPELFHKLRSLKHQDWLDILDRWVIQPNMLVVRARPSSTMAQRLESEEKARIQEQVSRLGPGGLEKRTHMVHEAKAKNEEPMPDEVVESIHVPDVKTITWISVQSASTIADSRELEAVEPSSQLLARHLEADSVALPFALHFDHVSSQFVTVTTYISLGAVPDDKKTLVYIFETLFFASEVSLEDGTVLSEAELIHQLEHDLVSYSLDHCDGYPELLCLSLRVDVARYDLAIQWMRRLLWSNKASTTKLQSRIAILKQSLPEYLRDPQSVLSELQAEELYTESFTKRAFYARRLIEWVPEFERRLKQDPRGVVNEVEDLRASLLKPSELRFSVIGDVLKLDRPRSSWLEKFQSLPFAPVAPVRLLNETLSTLGKKPGKRAVIVSLANIESSFSSQHALGILGFSHPQTPALLVALDVLSGAELYFWKRIRGAGLAYGASASLDVQIGHVSFDAWTSPNAAKAYQEAKRVVEGLVNGTIPLENHKLEAAKSSYAYTLAEGFSTRSSMAHFIFTNRVLRGRSSSWIQDRLAAIQDVTVEEVLDMMKQHILPLFQSETSVAFVVCGPGQVDDIASGYRAEGYDVEIRHMDDRVPWADDAEDSNFTTKALKLLGKAVSAGEMLVKWTQGLFHL